MTAIEIAGAVGLLAVVVFVFVMMYLTWRDTR